MGLYYLLMFLYIPLSLYETNNSFHFILNLQSVIMTLIRLEKNGVQIGAGIWCGIAFVIAGVLTIFPGSTSVITLRKVMLIVSIIFASFFAFWAFIGAFLHAIIDAFDNDYNENRWLRVTQGFCAIFEIVLASVTLSQRISDQEGNVIATPQPIVLAQPIVQPIYQPVVQTGYQPVYQHGVQPGVQFQALAYPPTAPPTYTG
jgi:hypothetical protein